MSQMLKFIYGVFSIVIFFVNVCNCVVYNYHPSVNKYYGFYNSPMTWNEARSRCSLDNAMLAMPADTTEAQILDNILQNNNNNHTQFPFEMFIGFHQQFDNGDFITLLGDSVSDYYNNWDNTTQNQSDKCVSFARGKTLLLRDCQYSMTFMCEKRVASDKINKSCLNKIGYTYAPALKKCYKLDLNALKWSEARSSCHAEGGHLAIIRNKDEENFLTNMYRKIYGKYWHTLHNDQAYLGVHDLYQEGSFVTVLDEDFSKIGYSRWGVPPAGGTEENCVTIHTSGVLNDFPCHIPAVFFCEISDKVVQEPKDSIVSLNHNQENNILRINDILVKF